MYSTCLYCNRPLGRNDVIEAFPVGRRLAFDPARGRLWVVCGHCARWNLTPLEERFEAIEDCERRFRATVVRVCTDHVGLARLGDGLELVRVGRPLRPEFAAWRYGDRFLRRRRRRERLVGAGTLTALGAAFAGGALVGVAALLGLAAVPLAVWRALGGRRPDEIVARVPGRGEAGVLVYGGHLAGVRVWGDGRELHLHLRRTDDAIEYAGDEARRVAALLVPHVNRAGALSAETGDAVAMIEAAGDPRAFLATFRPEGTAPRLDGPPDLFGRPTLRQGLGAIPSTERLALEMAVHEEGERRVAEGELVALEAAWRAADEIASIADRLLPPPGIDVALERLARQNPG